MNPASEGRAAPSGWTDGGTRGKPTPRRSEPPSASRKAWDSHPKWGRCSGCGQRGRLFAHHVLLAQYVERVAPDRLYDPANRMLLGPCCHSGHHSYGVEDRRIPMERVPAAARAFAIEVIGDGPAERYFSRRYG